MNAETQKPKERVFAVIKEDEIVETSNQLEAKRIAEEWRRQGLKFDERLFEDGVEVTE